MCKKAFGSADFFALLVLLFFHSSGLAAPVQIGLVSGGEQARDPADEWAWALRGGGAEIVKLGGASLEEIPNGLQLIVIDDVPLSREETRTISRWTEKGGLLIVAGATAAMQRLSEMREVVPESDFGLADILGARFGGWDFGIMQSYPYVEEASPLLSPLLPGDGIRLGQAGVDSDIVVAPTTADVLARSARLDLSKGTDGIVRLQYPAILANQAERGWTLFLTASLARVTSCYPAPDGQAVDCTAASTARALMRWLAANLLWEKKGIQVPLLWEIPSERPHGVLVTGDVHQDANDIQIRAARLMAERMEPNAIPLSLFIEGRLGAKVSSHVGALRGMPHVELEAHSNDGSVYSPRTKKYVVGAENVLRDINQARAGLGITKEHQEAGGLTAMRTHGWSTDEDSVSALHGAGVGLLLDQMSDLAMHKDHNTPLRFWFRAPVNRRLFVPLAERSISTASDDFVLSDELLGEMVSIPSPQCDPCCNDEVSWDDYQAYVEKFHLAFDRLATMGGLAEIWLFHPSTPAVKAGMTSLIEFLNRIRRAPTVVFLQGDAFATWLANREISSVRPVLDGSGRLRAMSLHNKESLRMLPPGSPPDYKRAYFWVLGESSVPGWAASAWKDPFERTVTVLHASTEAP